MKVVKRLAERIFHCELALMAVVALLLFYPTRWAPLFFLPALGVAAARRAVTGRWFAPTPLDGALVALAGAALIGFAVSVDRELSWTRLWYTFLGCALSTTLASWVRSERRQSVIAHLLVVGGLGVLLVALVGTDWSKVRLLNLAVYEHLPALLRNPVWGGLIAGRGRAFNPRAISFGVATLVPALVAIAAHGQSRVWRRGAAVLAVALGGLLVLLQSIQGIVGATLGVGVLLLWGRRRWIRALGGTVVVAIVLGAVWALGPGASTVRVLATRALSIDDVAGAGVVLRLDIWNRALAMLRDLAFTGAGLDGYERLQVGFYPGLLLGPEVHAHTLLLQVALDLGMPGLISFLGLLVAFFRMVALADARSSANALLRACTAGVVAYLGAGTIDVPWSTKSGLILWVLLGVAAGVTRPQMAWPRPANGRSETTEPEQTVAQEPSGWRRGWWVPVLALVLAGLAALLWPGRVAMNLGLVQAHRWLTEAQSGAAMDGKRAEQAVDLLARAQERGLLCGDATRTLGRLYGWTGAADVALEVLAEGVAWDLRSYAGGPLTAYAPWVAWSGALADHAPSDDDALSSDDGGSRPDDVEDLAWIYGHWKIRYPEHAETYAQIAWLWASHRSDAVRACAVLDEGLRAGARPEGVLSYARDRFGCGAP